MKLFFRSTGSGRPVVLLHGLFGMSDNLQAFAKMLAEKGFEIFSVDLRNHGQSPHDPVHTYEAMAEDVAAFIEENKLDKPLVIGHSMGGKVVLQLLIDHPQAAFAAVVIDIAPYEYPVHHREIIDALKSLDPGIIKTRGDAEDKLKESISDISTRQFLLKNLYWKTDTQLDWRFNLPVIDEQIENVGKPTWPDAPLHIPVCFIAGAKSHYIDPERTDEIMQHYPLAEFITIPDTGHWIHAEKPVELTNAVLEFLSKI
jgi:pimeloyl-ACP methyl ester carboxylesterase